MSEPVPATWPPNGWPIDLAAAVEKLGCSERWLRGYLAKHGCHRRAGRRILFTEADWNELLETMKQPGAAQSRLSGATAPVEPLPRRLERLKVLLRRKPKRTSPAKGR